MQSKKLITCAIACIPCFLVASNLNAQTQRQQNNPLDQLKPAEDSVGMNLAENTASSVSESGQIAKTKIALTSISVKRVIPDAEGKAVSQLEAINDKQLDSLINKFLSATQHAPTYGQLNELTAQLSSILRDRGELLSTVYIPAQKIMDGELELHLLKGSLGKVEVSGQATRASDVISGLFDSLLGKVVTRDEFEEQLLRIQNLLPGVSAKGAFRSGDKPGESDVVIDATEFDIFEGIVYADNYGNETTGQIRFGTRLQFNNPTGFEDVLKFDLVANETPDGFDDPQNPIEKNDFQCCFGGVSYEVFSDSLKYSYGIEWSHTSYDIGNNADFDLAILGFSGESDSTRLFFNIYSNLSSTFSDVWTYSWSFTQSELSARNEAFGGDVIINRDEVPEFDLGYTFTLRRGQNVYYGRLNTAYRPDDYDWFPIPSEWVGEKEESVNSFGQGIPPSRVGSDLGNSVRFLGDLNIINRSFFDNINIKGRLAFQLSYDVLAPSQQYSLTGPYGVRAYPSGSFLADSALLASVDVQIPVTSDLELSVFYDIGHGKVNDDNPAAEFNATIQGLGVGFDYRHKDQFSIKLTAASGVGVSDGNIRNGGEDVTGRDDTQLFASFIYNF